MSIFEQICNEQDKINQVLNYIRKEYYNCDEDVTNKVAVSVWKNQNNCISNIAAKIMMVKYVYT